MSTLGRSVFFGLLLAIQPTTIRAEPWGEPICAERPTLVTSLIGTWGELPALVGRTPSQVMEVWLNPETGTWTLLVTDADGWSCVQAAGDEGMRIPENPTLMPNVATVGGGW